MELLVLLILVLSLKTADAVVISAEHHLDRRVDVTQSTTAVAEAGGETILKCTSASTSRVSNNNSSLSSDTSLSNKSCSWELNGKKIQQNSSRHSFGFDESQVCELRIHPVLASDAGQYACKYGQLDFKASVLKVVSRPGQPHISQAIRGEVVEVGQGGQVQEDHLGQVELTCETLGAYPPADILWRHGDGTLVTGEMVDLVTMMEANVFRTKSTLRLLPDAEETVLCAAFNEAFPDERISNPVKLRVRHPPSVTLTFTSSSTISAGETAELECIADAYPGNLTYMWTVDGQKVEGEDGSTLRLEHLGPEADGSIVICQVRNSVGKSWASQALSVKHGPTFVHQPQPAFAKSGKLASFNCEAEGNPPPRYVWIKKSSQQLVGYGPKLSLPASSETEGLYVCKAFGGNSTSVSSAPAPLAVLNAPKVILENKKTAVLGSDVVINCQVAGPVSPNTTLLWLQGEEPVGEQNEHIGLLRRPDGLSLLLRRVTREDLGKWVCFSSNEVGTDYKEVELTEESDILIGLAIVLNILAALSLFALFLVCKRLRKGNVELMEKEKLKFQEESPIYKGGGDSGILNQLLPGCKISASSTMVDISSLQSDQSYQDIKWSEENRRDDSSAYTVMDCSNLTSVSLLSEDDSFEKIPELIAS